jgi:hypothetical protein
MTSPFPKKPQADRVRPFYFDDSIEKGHPAFLLGSTFSYREEERIQNHTPAYRKQRAKVRYRNRLASSTPAWDIDYL